MSATLSPLVDKPLVQAAGVCVEGRAVAAEQPLERALQLLELEWQTLAGDGDAHPAGDEAGVTLKESWLAGDAADTASMLRLASQRTMGVVTGNDAAQDAGSVARCICAAAGGGAEVEAVQTALAAAAAGEGGEQAESGTASAGEAASRLERASKACVAALRVALDALAA
eukprot:1798566-Pleurochrysis_carterae.AAC.2